MRASTRATRPNKTGTSAEGRIVNVNGEMNEKYSECGKKRLAFGRRLTFGIYRTTRTTNTAWHDAAYHVDTWAAPRKDNIPHSWPVVIETGIP